MRIRITALFLIIALLASICGCAKADKQDETVAGHHQTEREETTSKNQTDNTVPSTYKAGKNDENATTDVDSTDELIVQTNEETEETIESAEPVEDDTDPAPDEGDEALSPKQASSIAMLHYLSTVSQEIESAKDAQNSRLLLEDVYSSLLNNVTAAKIDSTTQGYLNDLLKIIEKYRMIAIKRDRLKVLYDQDKASLMRNAVPNPLSILSITNAKDWKTLVSSVVYTAVDSYNRYKSAESELDKQFMISGWELDDEEAANIHDNRLKAFNYMLDIVRNNGLPECYRLTEDDIIDFVEYINSDNLYDKIQFLKHYEAKYSSFGSYWLERASCYYEQGQYKQCVDCVWNYEDLQTGYLATGIFKQDHAYAEVLPKAIVSAQQVYAGESYVEIISSFTNALTNNAADENWALQYFAAQSFIDLYSRTQDKSYLEKAYEIVKNNVRLLKKQQVALNSTYLCDLEELKLEDMPDDWYLSESKKEKLEKQRKEEQKKLDALNKSLEEKRKTELPSLYEPLILNCDLLFALADELDIDNEEKEIIEGLLQDHATSVFLTKPVAAHYSFGTNIEAVYNAEFDEDTLIVPADLLCDTVSISSIVQDTTGITTFSDWQVSKVDRTDEELSSFFAYCYCDDLDSFTWSEGATITIFISFGDICEPIVFTFEVTEYTERWGPIPDTIVFTQIKE